MTRLMPTIAGKTHDSGNVLLNTDMTEEERDNNMLHILMTEYALKIGPYFSRNKVKQKSRRN